MKIPKFFRKPIDTEDFQRITLEKAKRHASAESMARGGHIMPIACTDAFSKSECASLPDNMIPWVRVESPDRVYLFTYAHFEMDEDDILRVVRKGETVPGLVICIYTGDGEPWPTRESQTMIEVPYSPLGIVGTELGRVLLERILIHFSPLNKTQTEGGVL